MAFLISKLLGKDINYIIITVSKKDLVNLLLKEDYAIDMHRYNMPSFVSREIIVNLSSSFNKDEIYLDRLSYEAEHNINC